MKTLLLIDANALIHRSFHALPPFTSPEGEPTGALYGLSSILIKTLKENPPDYVAAAFDRPEPTFRDEMFKDYKAHRPPAAEELISQIIRSRELFKEFGVQAFEKAGFEADDIIGSLCQKFKNQKDLKVVILTGDLDALQLVENDKVVVLAPKKGISETMIYNEAAVLERYGLKPEKLIDYKGLVGDVSDNIPGVKGVGPKTAEKLLSKYDSLENLYEKMPESDLSAKKVLPFKEMAFLSKKLATINKSVPIEAELDSLAYSGLDLPILTAYFTKLGFKSLIDRILKTNNKEGDKKPMPEKETKNVTIPKNTLFFFDAPSATKAVDKPSSSKIKVAFDWKTLIKEGADPKNPLFDLKIAGWLIDPDQKDFSFGAITKRFLYKELNERNESNFSELFLFLEEKIKEYGLAEVFEKIEMPLIRILADMELRGVRINPSKLKSLGQKIESELKDLALKIYEGAGGPFNINSPRQVSEILFGKLGLSTSKKTAGGKYSTAEDVLLKIKDRHPIISPLLAYRENFKIKSTYVDPLLEASEKTKRIHTTFLQTGTGTGRLSSEKPNLQNIPQESKWSGELRRAFEGSPGYSFLSFDYSQLELRLLAHLSEDEELIEAFQNNLDIHKATAAKVFHVPLEKVTPEMRRLGKTLNFGVVYGMGARAFSETAELPLKEAQKFIEEYFKDFPKIKTWHEKIKAEAYSLGFVKNENGRRRWLFGASSSNPKERSEAERAAINMPIQSLGADILKLAMIKSFDFLKNEDLLTKKAGLILSIHDELLFEIADDILKSVVPDLKKIFETVFRLKVPLVVDIKSGKNWGEMKTTDF